MSQKKGIVRCAAAEIAEPRNTYQLLKLHLAYLGKGQDIHNLELHVMSL
jgi:hypothetical protein